MTQHLKLLLWRLDASRKSKNVKPYDLNGMNLVICARISTSMDWTIKKSRSLEQL